MMRTLLLLLLLTPTSVLAQAEHDFTVARVKYAGGGDWYSDPQSLPELLRFVRANTHIDVAPEAETVELSSEKLFTFPYLYLTGHGNMVLTEREAGQLRDYLLGGGFLHADDNYGLDQHFRREIRKVFPDRELVELPFSHDIYHNHFEFPNGLPKIHEHDGNPPQGFGILDDDGRVMLFYTFESDLGDGWEPEAVHNDSPQLRMAALRMGTNILTYAMMR
ncbi:MAG: DUF4159 domain-containing protein [Rhodothermales bacterium]|nr:DUF4159 domain-containing protein [Rhodothermales bacterium]MBO6779092.1 DUF4159 domain-containing protein [Rhodothermales bacterium]